MPIINKVVSIDSRFRENFDFSTSSDFFVSLNYPLSNVISMRLEEIEIPNTWYSISKKLENNTFTIDGVIYTILDGNYDFDSFKTVLTGLIPGGYDINVDPNTNKITISFDSPPTNFELKFNTETCHNDKTRTLGWLMGYRESTYSGSSSYTSEGIFDLGGNRYFYLVVKDYSNSNVNDFIIGNLKSSYLNDDILARLTMVGIKYSVLNIQILDEYGDIIDLNQMDLSLVLEFRLVQ